MLITCPVAGKEKSRRLCEAFRRGAPRDADGFVFYGVDSSNVLKWEYARRHDRVTGARDWFYIDNSYFDATRGWRFRVTKNRVQVDPRHLVSDGKRFDALGINLRPFLSGSRRHAVVCPQSDSFMQHVARWPGPQWLQHHLATLSSWDVRVRSWQRDKAKAMQSLAADLRDAAVLITHSSSAAVQAVINGVPVIVSEMSAVSCLVNGDGSDRARVLSVLADHEFTLDELEDGTAWRRLNP